MESGNQLGIYWRANHATVVCLAQGKEKRLLDAFSVSVEEQAEGRQQALADRIAAVCRERKVRWAEAAVALDCAAFMQHTVHSEFRDPRKIAATVRFDTEEALASDVADVAVAFRIASSTEEGADLDVFTAQRGILSDIILSLQSNGIDPVSIDPDICCLARYLAVVRTEETSPRSTLYALLSDCRGYLVIMSGAGPAATLRTFLLGATQDRNAVLGREMLVTTGLADGAGPVDHLSVLDTKGEVVTSALGGTTGRRVDTCRLAESAAVTPGDLADGTNVVDFALAYGAALALAETANTVSFRNDHMPYLGRKRRIQKAVRFLSIAVTVLLLTLGVYVHVQLLRVNQQRQALRDKFEPDYRAAMVSAKSLPPTMRKAVDNLRGTLRNIKAVKSGTGANQATVSARLTLVLQALNGCAAQIGLNIESISVSPTNIQIKGDTSSRQNTVSVLKEALKKVGLAIKQEHVEPEGTRDSFIFTLEPVAAAQGN